MSREMKYSGIVEGFNIPTQWQTMKFGKVCSVVTDFVASGSFADLRANVPYLSEPDYAMLVRTTDLAKTARSEGKVYISKESYDFLSNSNLFGGEIVLPNIGSIGDAYVVPNLYEHMSLAPNAIMFKTNYCDKYYYYYFLSKIGKLQLDEISQSTAIAKFNKTDLKQLRVVLPTLSEQQRIASFLDRKCAEIDEMIALQEKIVEELKAYKQSVITEAVTKGLNPDAPLKDSGIEWIGKIPEQWRVCRVKDVLELGKDGIKIGPFGSSLTNKVNGDGECKIYGQWNIVNKDFTAGKNFVSAETYRELDAYKIVAGDILVSMMGTIGKCAIIPNGLQDGIMDSHVIKIRINKSIINPEYFELMYDKDNSTFIFEQLSRMKKGSIMDGLNSSIVKRLYLLLPPIDEQQEIVSYLLQKRSEIESLISIKQRKIDDLKEYKKSIIYEYVTGKKEVTE